MSWTFLACVLIAFVWIGMFYLWGRTFLIFIHAERDIASSVVFGYLVLQVIYQVIYLPFYLTRGSYRAVSYTWLSIIAIVSLFLIVHIFKKQKVYVIRRKRKEIAGITVAIVMILGIAFYIALHVPFYGQDTVTYISAMNESYYRDAMWIRTRSTFHYGMSSMFQLFTIPSLLTGIKPYYISLFSVRIVGICLFALITYRTGIVITRRKNEVKFSWFALSISVLAPILLMFWGSIYTAEFFYWRINEAKGFCQFVLLPLGFSVFLAMFKENADRKTLWKEQMLVGLAAVAVSASSLTPYLFLLFIGMISLLAFDKMKKGWGTVGRSLICMIPNLVYLVLYVLEKQGLIVF